MSVVVAIKYKDGIIMGGDKQSTAGNYTNHNGTKVMKTDYSNIGLGTVGCCRIGNIIEAMGEVVPAQDILEQDEVDRKYIINVIVPTIFNKMNEQQQVVKDVEGEVPFINARIMICTNKLINAMYENGALLTYDNFGAIGCGEQYVLCHLNVLSSEKDFSKLSKKEATEIIADCIKKACKDDPFIDDNIDFIYLDN